MNSQPKGSQEVFNSFYNILDKCVLLHAKQLWNLNHMQSCKWNQYNETITVARCRVQMVLSTDELRRRRHDDCL